VSTAVGTNLHTQTATLGPFNTPGVFPISVRYTNVYGSWTQFTGQYLTVQADISNLTMSVLWYADNSTVAQLTPYMNGAYSTVNKTQCGSLYVPRDMEWTANFSVATGTPVTFAVYADNSTTNYTLGNATLSGGQISNMTGTLTLPPIDYINDNYTATLTVQAMSFNNVTFSTLTNVYTVSPIWVNPQLMRRQWWRRICTPKQSSSVHSPSRACSH
jgi:hypothetical protein